MVVTVLAVAFLILLLLVAVVGFKTIIRQGKPTEDLNKERCSICRDQVLKTQLVERQIGDFKLLFFCASCIAKLHTDILSKN